MHYDWQSTLFTLAAIITLTYIGKKLVFLIPDIQRMIELNKQADRVKLAKKKYPPALKKSQMSGLATNVLVFVGIVPFVVTSSFDMPVWRFFSDVFLVIMLHDFMYYMTHRFLFHGQGYLRRVHALHHQAREVSHVDSLYVHPVENFIGIMLFGLSLLTIGLLFNGLNVLSVALSVIIFTQVSVINHTIFELDYFPFRTINYLTTKHHAHHENMQKGNYAGITVFYDWLFGTLDSHSKA